MNTDSTRPREADARARAWRTLAQGLLVDVAVGAGVGLAAATAAGIQWTDAYWLALAIAVGKSAATAGVSYLARKVVPPQ